MSAILFFRIQTFNILFQFPQTFLMLFLFLRFPIFIIFQSRFLQRHLVADLAGMVQ